MRSLEIAALMVGLLAFSGCDQASQHARSSREHESAAYRAAMADYSAGRLDKALEGLKRLIADEPDNASARFQLACLEQDHAKDYLAAYCDFREYSLLAGNSDKASVASVRAADCQRLFAANLQKGVVRADDASLAAENVRLQGALKEAEKARETLSENLAATQRELAAARRSVLQYRRMADGGEGAAATAPRQLPTERELLEDDAEDEGDRLAALSAEMRAVREEGEAESEAKPFATTARPTTPAPTPAPASEDTPARPGTYVVVEGDTLRAIATRFYGKPSMWTTIRNANKTTISTDGRVRAGQRIILP